MMTPKGWFYTNAAWLWNFYSGWNTSQPYSEQEINISDILWREDLDKINFDDNDIMFDDKEQIVYITCKKESSFNNFIIWYNVITKAFFTIDWLNIARFMKDWENIYWIWSETGKIFQLFDTSDQEWLKTTREFKFEVNMWTLDHLYNLRWFKVKWFWEKDIDCKIYLDIYDKRWDLKEWYKVLTLSSDKVNSDLQWFNEVSFWGSISWANITWWPSEILASSTVKINWFQRLIIRVVSEDTLFHKFNWFEINSEYASRNTKRQYLN